MTRMKKKSFFLGTVILLFLAGICPAKNKAEETIRIEILSPIKIEHGNQIVKFQIVDEDFNKVNFSRQIKNWAFSIRSVKRNLDNGQNVPGPREFARSIDTTSANYAGKDSTFSGTFANHSVRNVYYYQVNGYKNGVLMLTSTQIAYAKSGYFSATPGGGIFSLKAFLHTSTLLGTIAMMIIIILGIVGIFLFFYCWTKKIRGKRIAVPLTRVLELEIGRASCRERV